ncbi:type II toxin-antitoxin system VapC family toxin [Candidatus Saccharibacteria bacterium]|nr:type II toxin-antitoxin system VapC family toxin [Candidatus Saccharibacteria bacterium]
MILLDANVLLEMLIAGRPRKAKVLRWMEQNTAEYCISMLTVHLVLHFGLKDGLSISQIKTFLSYYPKIALLPEDYVEAIKILRDQDHEDAIQLSLAERIGCDHIVTLDQKFADTYKNRLQFITI